LHSLERAQRLQHAASALGDDATVAAVTYLKTVAVVVAVCISKFRRKRKESTLRPSDERGKELESAGVLQKPFTHHVWSVPHPPRENTPQIGFGRTILNTERLPSN
jgi:hypothetical protein